MASIIGGYQILDEEDNIIFSSKVIELKRKANKGYIYILTNQSGEIQDTAPTPNTARDWAKELAYEYAKKNITGLPIIKEIKSSGLELKVQLHLL